MHYSVYVSGKWLLSFLVKRGELAGFSHANDSLVTYLVLYTISDPELYSGMWWQDRVSFLAINFTIPFLESASFEAITRRPNGKSRTFMTVDWLDLSAEHLSKYIKHFIRSRAPVVVDGIRNILANFTRNVRGWDLSSMPDVAVHETIALLPIRGSTLAFDRHLILLQLAATLASLWRTGIGRAVVVGLSDLEKEIADEVFALMKDHLAIRPMELAYAQNVNNTVADAKIVPRVALRGLQFAMNSSKHAMNENVVEEWLGSDPDRWKYVYFSEPDLILHTRPSALPAISEALSRGILMAAHRLELVPHERDFPAFWRKDRLLPDVGSFASVQDLDPLEGDACCDQGSFYPSNRMNPENLTSVRRSGECPGLWLHCGFDTRTSYTGRAAMLEKHRRLLGYPLFSVKGGSGIPLVASNQRVCVPRRGPATCGKMS
jgi:hypothetical protein